MIDFKKGLQEVISSSSFMVDEPMKNHTSLKIGGPADYFIIPQNPEEIRKLLAFTRKEFIPLFVFGGGTNLLVSDKGIRGITVKINKPFRTLNIKGTRLKAGAGFPLPQLALKAARAGLSGLEFAGGIPGNSGGAAIINAGAYGNSMADIITSIKVLTWQGEERVIPARELEFGYRHSNLLRENWIVMEISLRLVEGDYGKIRSRMEELLEHRRQNHPQEPSAGSVFRNPPGEHAGKLIEGAGCKGLGVGDARVSHRHANFIVNLGNSSYTDYLKVINMVRDRVHQKFGIFLEPEISIVGEDS